MYSAEQVPIESCKIWVEKETCKLMSKMNSQMSVQVPVQRFTGDKLVRDGLVQASLERGSQNKYFGHKASTATNGGGGGGDDGSMFDGCEARGSEMKETKRRRKNTTFSNVLPCQRNAFVTL